MKKEKKLSYFDCFVNRSFMDNIITNRTYITNKSIRYEKGEKTVIF